MDLGLAVGPQRDQLGPVPHQLPQLPRGRRRDPGFGQPAHPQQIRQISGVPDVVLDPAILKRLHPQRVRQMHSRTGRPERVDRPVPAVGGLQHHLRVFACPIDHPLQALGVVENPDRLQHFPGVGQPDNHAASAMQIDTHKLLSCVL